MKKRLTAVFLAALMSIPLCACGDSESVAENSDIAEQSTLVGEEASSEPTEAESAAETSAESDSESGNAESASPENEESTVPVDEDELAEVQQVADKYFKAVAEQDYDTLLEVTDVELIYYLSTGETGDRDQYIECLKDIVSDGNSYQNCDISSVYKEDDRLIEQYEDFFKIMDEATDTDSSISEQFTIDNIYAVRLKDSGSKDISNSSDDSDGVSVDISGSFDYDVDIDMPIIHINGEWKCDPGISMMIALYNAFSGMADSLSSAE